MQDEHLIAERVRENKRKGMSEADAVVAARKKKLPKGSGPGTDDSLTISSKKGGKDINLGRPTTSPIKKALGAIGAIGGAMRRLRGES